MPQQFKNESSCDQQQMLLFDLAELHVIWPCKQATFLPIEARSAIQTIHEFPVGTDQPAEVRFALLRDAIRCSALALRDPAGGHPIDDPQVTITKWRRISELFPRSKRKYESSRNRFEDNERRGYSSCDSLPERLIAFLIKVSGHGSVGL